jgi:hypothetical protein
VVRVWETRSELAPSPVVGLGGGVARAVVSERRVKHAVERGVLYEALFAAFSPWKMLFPSYIVLFDHMLTNIKVWSRLDLSRRVLLKYQFFIIFNNTRLKILMIKITYVHKKKLCMAKCLVVKCHNYFRTEGVRIFCNFM